MKRSEAYSTLIKEIEQNIQITQDKINNKKTFKQMIHSFILSIFNLKEYKYEEKRNTILENLLKIESLCDILRFDPIEDSIIKAKLMRLDVVEVVLRGSPHQNITKYRAMRSLNLVENQRSWGMDLKYHLNFGEYEKFYNNPFQKFMKENFIPLINLVEKNFSNPDFSYYFNRYEDSIASIANTIEEAKELNGKLPEELKKNVTRVLGKIYTIIDNKEKEIQKLKELEKEAMNKSLVERITFEDEFVDLDVNIFMPQTDVKEEIKNLDLDLRDDNQYSIWESQEKNNNLIESMWGFKEGSRKDKEHMHAVFKSLSKDFEN